MNMPSDDNLIETAKSEISKNCERAIVTFCVLLASPEKFKDTFEWSYFLGKLFSMVMERTDFKRPPELRYDEVGEMIIDEKIRELLTKFNSREKANVVSFLLSASTPLTQEKIDSMVSLAT